MGVPLGLKGHPNPPPQWTSGAVGHPPPPPPPQRTSGAQVWLIVCPNAIPVAAVKNNNKTIDCFLHWINISEN